MRMRIQTMALLSGLRIQCNHELWYSSRSRSDLVLLWLWCRLAAVAPIGSLAWEPPYASGAAIKKKIIIIQKIKKGCKQYKANRPSHFKRSDEC